MAEDLGLGVKIDALSKEKVRFLLKPWIVEAALVRMKDRQLTTDEQRIVVESTRTPEKVRWPDWWSVGEAC